MDVKRDWPVIVGVGLIVIALVVFATGHSTTGYTTVTPSNAAAAQIAQAQVAAAAQQQQTAGQALDALLSYDLGVQQLQTQQNIVQQETAAAEEIAAQQYQTAYQIANAQFANQTTQVQAAAGASKTNSFWNTISNIGGDVLKAFGL